MASLDHWALGAQASVLQHIGSVVADCAPGHAGFSSEDDRGFVLPQRGIRPDQGILSTVPPGKSVAFFFFFLIFLLNMY